MTSEADLETLDAIDLEPISGEQISLLSIDRDLRREALRTIFDELGASELRERIELTRLVRSEIARHRGMRNAFSKTRIGRHKKWLADVLKHARVLSDLAKENRALFYFLVGELNIENLVLEADHWLKEMYPPSREGRPHDIPLRSLIARLGEIYLEATGKKPGVSHLVADNQPTGPFFRFVQAVMSLLDEAQRPDALAKAIYRSLQLASTKRSFP